MRGRGVGGAGRGGRGLGGVPVSLAVPPSLVYLGMPLALIATGKLTPTLGAGKRLLSCVRANVCGQVVAAAEAAHADAALEWLLACVHTHMTRQLIRA